MSGPPFSCKAACILNSYKILSSYYTICLSRFFPHRIHFQWFHMISLVSICVSHISVSGAPSYCPVCNV